MTLTDNEVAGTFQWSLADVSGLESTTLLLTVTRTGGTASDVEVYFTVHDGDADMPGGHAQAGIDYTVVTPSPLTFGQNVSSQTVEISLLPRDGVQGPRAFRVVLDFATSGLGLESPGSPSTVTVWILDPPPPPD